MTLPASSRPSRLGAVGRWNGPLQRLDAIARAPLTRRSFLASSGLAVLAVKGSGQFATAATLSMRTPLQSDRVVDTWGINTHLNWQHSVWADEVAVTDLLLELGVRHIRGLVSPRMAAQRYSFSRLRDNGCKVEAMMGERVDGTTLAGARDVVNFRLDEIVNYYGGSSSGVFSALEGCNEPNNDGVPESTWIPQTRNLSQAIWEEAKKRPGSAGIPVVGPGLARQVGTNAPTPEHDFAVVGNLSPWADYANIHVYPRGNRPSDEITRFMTAARQAYPGGENYHTTEGGYFNAMKYTRTISPPTPEDVASVYAPRHILEHVLRRNHRFFTYELLDDLNPANDDREANFGYIRTPALDSSTWSRKPSFYAMKNLLGMLSDPGASFTPAALALSISGGGTDLKSLLLQKRSGRYSLCLWRDIDIYKWDRFTQTGSMLPITSDAITVDLAVPAPVSIFRPTDSAAPVQSYELAASFTVPLSGQVVIAEIG